MTDIEQKALALLNEVACDDTQYSHINRRYHAQEALCLAIEQHEAFRQEVSDAVTALLDRFLGDGLSQGVINGHLHQFIIRKPDPLVEVVKEVTWYDNEITAKELRAALDARGLEIREKNDG